MGVYFEEVSQGGDQGGDGFEVIRLGGQSASLVL